MREEKHLPEKFVPLSHCLMESDAEMTRLARRTRRRSMLLSTAIEATLLVAAVVVPLFASHAIPLIINDPPLPPPRGYTRLVDPPPAGQRQTTTVTHPPRDFDLLIAPPRIPQDIAQIDDRAAPPSIGGSSEDSPSCIACVPNGILDPSLFHNETRVLDPPRAPVPTTESRAPLPVSTGVQEAKLIHRVEPIYPPLMRQIRKSGRVELRAIIARDGTVSELTVVKADPGFILSAQQAVLQWRYRPTLLNGEPVEVETRITVIFTIGAQ